MSNCIFTIGKKDKKLIIPLIYLLAYTLINIFDSDEQNIVDTYLENFAMSISEIMGFFISVIVKHIFKIKLNQKANKQNYLKDFGILFVITAFYKLNDILPYALDRLNGIKENDDSNDKNADNSVELFINNAIELIIITIVTYFTLKYKYYIHHIISIIMIDLICVALDLAFLNFWHTNISTIISSLVLIFADSFLYSYLKYLIEFKYYFYLDLLYIYGIFCFFWNCVSLCSVVLIYKSKGSDIFIFKFYEYYKDNGIQGIVLRFFKGLVISGFIIDILEFIILDKLTPNYIIIAYEIGKIPSNIKNFIKTDQKEIEGFEILVCIAIIILSILQVICLLFYLEILELNFCNLNKNTKKNIEERELLLRVKKIDSTEIKSDDESYIMMKDYIIENGNRKIISEMSEGRSSDSSINK